jgi:type IV pilus assembly protein PilY1
MRRPHPLLLLMLAPALALAQVSTPEEAACTLQSTSRLDAMLNPTRGSDERFFTTSSGAPNILFVLDTSCSMREWPMTWLNTDFYVYGNNSTGVDPGCRQENVNALGYDPSVTYPRMWTGLEAQSSDWFGSESYYRFAGFDGDFGIQRNPVRFDQATRAPWVANSESDACFQINARTPAQLAACRSCLQRRGYFQMWPTNYVAKGNFLNFYSPRGHSATNVLSQVIRDTPRARFGIVTFSAGSGAQDTAGWSNQNTVRFASIGPRCDQASLQSQVDAHRDSLLRKLANGLQFNTNTPLTSSLYGAAYYFRSSTSDPFSTWFRSPPRPPSGFNDEPAPGRASVCLSCSFNAIVLLTDGEPNESYLKLPTELASRPVACEGCGKYEARADAAANGDDSQIHRVASWMWNNDLRPELPGMQRVATYTVGFALNNPEALSILRATAQAGGGRFYTATNTSQLKTAIQAIVDDVQNRSIAFSSASVSSFQTGDSTLSAVLPRMSPTRTETPWTGDLWRFGQFNEFIENRDRNGDGDREDLLLVDRVGDVVVEDNGGVFVKQGTSNFADQFWEARRTLQTQARVEGTPRSVVGRRIFTTLDTNRDGRLTHEDEMVEFTVASASRLRHYLGVLGTPACPTLQGGSVDPGQVLTGLKVSVSQAASTLRVSLSSPLTQESLDDLCVRVLVEFIRGMDFEDEDGDGVRDEVRSSVLGDIFHSSPVVVDPPVDEALCDLGIHAQCLRTLYSRELDGTAFTPLAQTRIERCGQERNVDAYEAYAHLNRRRDKLVLVGANDGMLHAFRDSVATERCVGGLPFIDYSPTGRVGKRTGEEVWAYIPPDLLSRLYEHALGHTYYVDGDIMVRDVWADGSGRSGGPNGVKEPEEFHTLAVVAEGRGGVHYFALDLDADPDSGDFQVPRLRWMFPQPDSAEAALFGKTLYSLSPRPPPVGPVLIQSTSPQGAIERYGVPTQERWVVMLSGGWSPMGDKGRGVYMVDAYEGTVNGRRDNLWWKFDYDPSANSDRTRPQRELTHGVASPVAMVDYGYQNTVRMDGFFDTAVFGDLIGQLWVARFSVPGRVDSSTRLVGNWSAGRTFQMDRDGINSSGNGRSVRNVWPFYYLPSLGVQPDTGVLRAMVGTGDRYSLLDEQAGTCRFDNPIACAKYQCGMVKLEYKLDRLNMKLVNSGHTYQRDRHIESSFNVATNNNPACGNPNSKVVEAEFFKHEVINCPNSSTGPSSFGDVRRMRVECGRDGRGLFSCLRADGNPQRLGDLTIAPAASTLAGLGSNRFYGLRVYGGTVSFDETGTGQRTARGFDEVRLTDRTAANPTGGDLVNVTATTCNATGLCTGAQATGTQAGWVMDYADGLSHKTASGSTLLASCAVWSSIYPEQTAQACSTSAARSRFFQADFITGAPNCASALRDSRNNAWLRFSDRAVMAPPAEPAATIQVSKDGRVKYSAVLLEPGSRQATELSISQGNDLLQSIYELPLTRAEHACRHMSASACNGL